MDPITQNGVAWAAVIMITVAVGLLAKCTVLVADSQRALGLFVAAVDRLTLVGNSQVQAVTELRAIVKGLKPVRPRAPRKSHAPSAAAAE